MFGLELFRNDSVCASEIVVVEPGNFADEAEKVDADLGKVRAQSVKVGAEPGKVVAKPG